VIGFWNNDLDLNFETTGAEMGFSFFFISLGNHQLLNHLAIADK